MLEFTKILSVTKTICLFVIFIQNVIQYSYLVKFLKDVYHYYAISRDKFALCYILSVINNYIQHN